MQGGTFVSSLNGADGEDVLVLSRPVPICGPGGAAALVNAIETGTRLAMASQAFEFLEAASSWPVERAGQIGSSEVLLLDSRPDTPNSPNMPNSPSRLGSWQLTGLDPLRSLDASLAPAWPSFLPSVEDLSGGGAHSRMEFGDESIGDEAALHTPPPCGQALLLATACLLTSERRRVLQQPRELGQRPGDALRRHYALLTASVGRYGSAVRRMPHSRPRARALRARLCNAALLVHAESEALAYVLDALGTVDDPAVAVAQWVGVLSFEWQGDAGVVTTARHGEFLLSSAGAQLAHGGEYTPPCAQRMPLTPPTARAYLALSAAMHAIGGGSGECGVALLGPSGACKTETVAELAALGGRACLVLDLRGCARPGAAASVALGPIARLAAAACGVGGYGVFTGLADAAPADLALLVSTFSELCAAMADANRPKGGAAPAISTQPPLLGGVTRVSVQRGCALFCGLDTGSRGNRLPPELARLLRPVLLARPDSVSLASISLQCGGFKLHERISRGLVAALELAEGHLPLHDAVGLGSLGIIRSIVARACELRLALVEEDEPENETPGGVSATSRPDSPARGAGNAFRRASRAGSDHRDAREVVRAEAGMQRAGPLLLQALAEEVAPRMGSAAWARLQHVFVQMLESGGARSSGRATLRAKWDFTSVVLAARAAAIAAAYAKHATEEDAFELEEDLAPSEEESVEEALRWTIGLEGLSGADRLVRLALRLWVCLRARPMTVVLGGPSSGKSTVWRLLIAAMESDAAQASDAQALQDLTDDVLPADEGPADEGTGGAATVEASSRPDSAELRSTGGTPPAKALAPAPRHSRVALHAPDAHVFFHGVAEGRQRALAVEAAVGQISGAGCVAGSPAMRMRPPLLVLDGPLQGVEFLPAQLREAAVLFWLVLESETLADASPALLGSAALMKVDLHDHVASATATFHTAGGDDVAEGEAEWGPTEAAVAWLERQGLPFVECGPVLERCVREHLGPALAFVAAECTAEVPLAPMQVAYSFAALLHSLICSSASSLASEGASRELLPLLFSFALVQAIGAPLREADGSRERFSSWLLHQDSALTCLRGEPDAKSVFELLVDLDQKRMVWATDVLDAPAQLRAFGREGTMLWVPTSATEAAVRALRVLAPSGASALLVGPRGCGKSTLLARAGALAAAAVPAAALGTVLDASTTASALLTRLQAYVAGQGRKLFGTDALVLVVDDVHTPVAVGRGAAPPPLELLRQLMQRDLPLSRHQHGSVLGHLSGARLLGAWTLGRAGDNPLPARLLGSGMSLVRVGAPSSQCLRAVFASLLPQLLPAAKAAMQWADASVRLHDAVAEWQRAAVSTADDVPRLPECVSFHEALHSLVALSLLSTAREPPPKARALRRLWLSEATLTYAARTLCEAHERVVCGFIRAAHSCFTDQKPPPLALTFHAPLHGPMLTAAAPDNGSVVASVSGEKSAVGSSAYAELQSFAMLWRVGELLDAASASAEGEDDSAAAPDLLAPMPPATLLSHMELPLHTLPALALLRRCFASTGGGLTLAGPSRCGKRSIARLAAAMNGLPAIECFAPTNALLREALARATCAAAAEGHVALILGVLTARQLATVQRHLMEGPADDLLDQAQRDALKGRVAKKVRRMVGTTWKDVCRRASERMHIVLCLRVDPVAGGHVRSLVAPAGLGAVSPVCVLRGWGVEPLTALAKDSFLDRGIAPADAATLTQAAVALHQIAERAARRFPAVDAMEAACGMLNLSAPGLMQLEDTLCVFAALHAPQSEALVQSTKLLNGAADVFEALCEAVQAGAGGEHTPRLRALCDAVGPSVDAWNTALDEAPALQAALGPKCLLAAAALTYLPAFSESNRAVLLAEMAMAIEHAAPSISHGLAAGPDGKAPRCVFDVLPLQALLAEGERAAHGLALDEASDRLAPQLDLVAAVRAPRRCRLVVALDPDGRLATLLRRSARSSAAKPQRTRVVSGRAYSMPAPSSDENEPELHLGAAANSPLLSMTSSLFPRASPSPPEFEARKLPRETALLAAMADAMASGSTLVLRDIDEAGLEIVCTLAAQTAMRSAGAQTVRLDGEWCSVLPGFRLVVCLADCDSPSLARLSGDALWINAADDSPAAEAALLEAVRGGMPPARVAAPASAASDDALKRALAGAPLTVPECGEEEVLDLDSKRLAGWIGVMLAAAGSASETHDDGAEEAPGGSPIHDDGATVEGEDGSSLYDEGLSLDLLFPPSPRSESLERQDSARPVSEAQAKTARQAAALWRAVPALGLLDQRYARLLPLSSFVRAVVPCIAPPSFGASPSLDDEQGEAAEDGETSCAQLMVDCLCPQLFPLLDPPHRLPALLLLIAAVMVHDAPGAHDGGLALLRLLCAGRDASALAPGELTSAPELKWAVLARAHLAATHQPSLEWLVDELKANAPVYNSLADTLLEWPVAWPTERVAALPPFNQLLVSIVLEPRSLLVSALALSRQVLALDEAQAGRLAALVSPVSPVVAPADAPRLDATSSTLFAQAPLHCTVGDDAWLATVEPDLRATADAFQAAFPEQTERLLLAHTPAGRVIAPRGTVRTSRRPSRLSEASRAASSRAASPVITDTSIDDEAALLEALGLRPALPSAADLAQALGEAVRAWAVTLDAVASLGPWAASRAAIGGGGLSAALAPTAGALLAGLGDAFLDALKQAEAPGAPGVPPGVAEVQAAWTELAKTHGFAPSGEVYVVPKGNHRPSHAPPLVVPLEQLMRGLVQLGYDPTLPLSAAVLRGLLGQPPPAEARREHWQQSAIGLARLARGTLRRARLRLLVEGVCDAVLTALAAGAHAPDAVRGVAARRSLRKLVCAATQHQFLTVAKTVPVETALAGGAAFLLLPLWPTFRLLARERRHASLPRRLGLAGEPPRDGLGDCIGAVRRWLPEPPARFPQREALWRRPPASLPAVELVLGGEVEVLRALLSAVAADLTALANANAACGCRELPLELASVARSLLSSRTPAAWVALAGWRDCPLREFLLLVRSRARLVVGWLHHSTPSCWPLHALRRPHAFLRAVLCDFASRWGHVAGDCALHFSTELGDKPRALGLAQGADTDAKDEAVLQLLRAPAAGAARGHVARVNPSWRAAARDGTNTKEAPWLEEQREVSSKLLLTDLRVVGAVWDGATKQLCVANECLGSPMPTLIIEPRPVKAPDAGCLCALYHLPSNSEPLLSIALPSSADVAAGSGACFLALKLPGLPEGEHPVAWCG